MIIQDGKFDRHYVTFGIYPTAYIRLVKITVRATGEVVWGEEQSK